MIMIPLNINLTPFMKLVFNFILLSFHLNRLEAYYLEPEDLWYLLYQVKDSYVTVNSGTTTLLFTEDNIKQILIHKWNKGITQLPNTPLSSITISGENINLSLYNFRCKFWFFSRGRKV